jgi:drug/metabolite transporter (DMT)-like permease
MPKSMNTADLIFWLCALLNGALAAYLALRFHAEVKAGRSAETRAKRRYSWLCLAVGVFSGTVLFLGISTLFHVPLGHGEIMIAAPVFNLLLSCAFILVGRVVIGWRAMKW